MRNVKLTITWTIAAAAAGFALTGAMAGIVGSGHDFSPYGWSEFKICKPCHTPHNADTSVDAPLWNHELTTATYILYDSDTLHEEVEDPGPKSILCLSCHDGTVALDSFGGNTGMTFIEGDALLGTDLSDDHPIGIEWSHQNPDVNCFNCHNPYDPDWERPLPFFDNKMECLTCHEPHNQGQDPDYMLRLPILGSQLCLHCHNP
ncbi:MAG: hypothetical protein JSV91_06520 [Phycisphaerales bacterium]|nr:MAG: hypothetical protein JSV91_06520 [Phycisphaerales bacterium]